MNHKRRALETRSANRDVTANAIHLWSSWAFSQQTWSTSGSEGKAPDLLGIRCPIMGQKIPYRPPVVMGKCKWPWIWQCVQCMTLFDKANKILKFPIDLVWLMQICWLNFKVLIFLTKPDLKQLIWCCTRVKDVHVPECNSLDKHSQSWNNSWVNFYFW